MNKFFDILLPRFIHEEVAFLKNENGELEALCSVKDLHPNEWYDEIYTVRSFNLFGMGLFAKVID